MRLIAYKWIGPAFYEKLRYRYYQAFVKHAGYDDEYYQGYEAANGNAHDLFAKTVGAEFRPETVVDVGCGNGAISAAFLRYGCREAHAFDGSAAAIEAARKRGLTNVTQLDLISTKEIPVAGDLTVCCEVAEHLPEKYAAHLCELLSKPSPILVFTAAPPGQGGHLHVNLQPQSWWIDLMKKYGMNHDEEAVLRVRAAYGGKMIRDYDANLMIFRRA
ncbi:MAG TPA: methyltransferase domain-containing protein [Chthoniobacteraceae bacterium]|nr:methyltransferase domain-containing protein [Chthoniobacteraceae bacterium]